MKIYKYNFHVIRVFMLAMLLAVDFFGSGLLAWELNRATANGYIEKEIRKKVYDKYKMFPDFWYEYEVGRYFVLAKSSIGILDLGGLESSLSGWNIEPWEYSISSSLISDRYANIGLFEGDDIFTDWGRIVSRPGCLGLSPLRYGDIDGDSQPELILWLSGWLVIFSPDYERVIFSARVSEVDSVSFDHAKASLVNVSDTGIYPQYISELATMNQYSEWIPGARVYGKVFEGDFDSDGNVDLLVWQKEFLSNYNSNSQEGYGLYRDMWTHYERDIEAQNKSESGITGEYLPQETDEATIQSWLSDNDLTWSQGYPSISECEGEEGELIPEMHDPLLNDPDVLQ